MNLFKKNLVSHLIFDQTETMVPILTISVTWWKGSQVRNERKEREGKGKKGKGKERKARERKERQEKERRNNV